MIFCPKWICFTNNRWKHWRQRYRTRNPFPENLYGGKIVNRFVCIGEPKSTGSEDLFAFVPGKLNDNFLSNHMSKFVGFGCDGASNMMGCKSGLVTRLQEWYPEVVGIHCLAHRLEFSFRDVFKSNKLYGRLSTLLLGLFYFYKNSQNKENDCGTLWVYVIELSCSWALRHQPLYNWGGLGFSCSIEYFFFILEENQKNVATLQWDQFFFLEDTRGK